jgi:hypothetical protein
MGKGDEGGVALAGMTCAGSVMDGQANSGKGSWGGMTAPADDYSRRSASMGSTEAARRAGK